MPRRKVWGCPLTPRLIAKPRSPLRVSASMSIAISTTCVPAIAFTRNRVSPCETRKIRAPLPSIGHAIIGGCGNLSSDLRHIAGNGDGGMQTDCRQDSLINAWEERNRQSGGLHSALGLGYSD